MKVAIPVWQGRVSPVFDVAGQLLLVETTAGAERSRREQVLTEEDAARRADRLAGLGVETLICGAISGPLESLLADRGITVVSRVCGNVDDVLAAFRSGSLGGEQFAMPGCCGRARRFQRGSCRRRHRGAGPGRQE